jgi:hypothetical protein
MTVAESELLIGRIQENARAAQAPAVPGFVEALRAVVQEDEGREFVMVNLIRYRVKAIYPPGWDYGDDPRAADARYNRAVVPRLLKRACFPVFLGKTAGRFLTREQADDWDGVALVRYRSRRDLLAVCADLAGERADIQKWAAIETTHVFPVRVPFSLVMPMRLIAVTVLLILMTSFIVVS